MGEHNPFINSIVLDGSSWAAGAGERIILDATVIVPSGNTSNVNVRIDGGTSQVWPKGTSAEISGVDMSRLEFSGDAGDRVMVVGNTR